MRRKNVNKQNYIRSESVKMSQIETQIEQKRACVRVCVCDIPLSFCLALYLLLYVVIRQRSKLVASCNYAVICICCESYALILLHKIKQFKIVR